MAVAAVAVLVAAAVVVVVPMAVAAVVVLAQKQRAQTLGLLSILWMPVLVAAAVLAQKLWGIRQKQWEVVLLLLPPFRQKRRKREALGVIVCSLFFLYHCRVDF